MERLLGKNPNKHIGKCNERSLTIKVAVKTAFNGDMCSIRPLHTPVLKRLYHILTAIDHASITGFPRAEF
jgi:hypothetical protein